MALNINYYKIKHIYQSKITVQLPPSLLVMPPLSTLSLIRLTVRRDTTTWAGYHNMGGIDPNLAIAAHAVFTQSGHSGNEKRPIFPYFSTCYQYKENAQERHTGASKKKAINRERKSRTQIAANFVLKTMAITFLWLHEIKKKIKVWGGGLVCIPPRLYQIFYFWFVIYHNISQPIRVSKPKIWKHLSPYSTKKRVCVGCPTQMKSTKKTWNVHAQRKDPTPGTQRNLYSTGWRWGFASGQTQLLGFASGKNVKNLRHLTQNIPTCWYPCVRWRRSTIFCVRWRKSTRRQIFCVLVEYRL